MAIRCPHCSYENTPGSLICAKCYGLLVQVDKGQPSTTIQPGAPTPENAQQSPSNSHHIEAPKAGEATINTRMISVAQQQILTQRFSNLPAQLTANMVALYFDRREEPLILQIVQQAILGRYADDASSQPRVDLSPFGAYEKGVSRMHAVLRRAGTRLMIEDLDSSNGTFVNNIQIRPYSPRSLQNGDRIRLAQLDMALILPADLPVS